MARSFSQEAMSDSHEIGETRYRMSHIIPSGTIARTFLLAGILLAALFLASQTFFPAFAQENQMDETISYNENDTVPVATYTATDPEDEGVTWSVADVDGGTVDFDIDNGTLTFKSSPNFEAPTGGAADNSTTYAVTITVTDADGVKQTHTWNVTVNLQNVNEPGEVTFSHPQPKEGTAISVTLTDDDGPHSGDTGGTDGSTATLTDNASTTWQWYKSETGSDPWTKIEEMATSSSYTPTGDDVGHYLRATAMYFDAQDDEQRTAHSKVSDTNKVLVEEYINKAPVFLDDMGTAVSEITMSVPEDESLEAGDPVGQPVEATDDGEDGTPEVLTYTHGGTDSTSFTIDSASGQLKLAAGTTLDFETDPSYEVTVTATDPDGENNTATVTINLTDEDEAPTITETGTTDTYDENLTRAVLTYTATDEDADDDNATLSWKLSGLDAADFSITTPTGATGELTFNSPPNFEAAVDSNRDNIYNVTVEVADDAGNKDTRKVVVTIRNLDETASAPLTLTSHPQPEVNRPVTVRLDEPDGVSGSVSWVWTLGSETPVTQSGGTTNTFTPRATGALSVTANYTDRSPEAPQKNPSLATIPSVQERPTNDARPTFPNTEDGARTIDENAADDADANVGTAFVATDTDDSTLLYTLSGGDANAFTLADRTSGQISVPAGQELDFERKSTYRFTITATDPTGGNDRASQSVTVTLNPVAEPPEITAGKTAIEYLENGSAAVETYRATDDENDAARPRVPLDWSLTGDDDDDFSISQAGILTFNESPNFEAAADSGGNNVYNVTVTVSDGDTTTSNATEDVTITVINVDEDGEITGLPAQPKEEVAITVMLTDPDGGATGDGGDDGNDATLTDNASTTWQWFRSRSRTGGWALISATSTANEDVNTNSRTPEAADVGYYLRATAMYRDGQGVNKATKPGVGVTQRTVQAKEYVNKAPEFQDAEGNATSTITMEVNEDDRLEAGDPVGDPVTARDRGLTGTQETLIYTLDVPTAVEGDDQDSFTIDRLSGQLKLAGTATLDYEDDANTDHEYEVRVKAIDPAMASSTALVTIEIMPVEEAPEFGDEDATASPAENLAATSTVENTATTTVLSSYIATDDEDGADPRLTWSLGGADMDRFVLCDETASDPCTDPNATGSEDDNTVSLRFKEVPNYEAPADSGRNNVYNVTVVATDSDDGASEHEVTVTVTNMDEDGTVTLSHIQPEVGTSIRASLTDPDGGVSGTTWEWFWCTTPVDGECPDTPTGRTKINTTSSAYTPISDGRYIQAQATYTDRATKAGEDKRTASKTSANAVQVEDATNEPPVLPDVTQNFKIAENSEDTDPVHVVGTVAATSDPDDELDSLLYTLSGSDAALFTIHSGPEDTAPSTTTIAGMIRLKSGTELDFEDKKTYSVTVTVTDPSLDSDSVAVTIEVTDVDEPPFVTKRGLHVTGEANVSYEENDTADVGTYRVTGPDASGATLSLSGTDASAFSLSAGVLSFSSPPDFEAATDAGTDNVYNVTVMATMGDFSASQDVIVTVTNVDEPGTVALTYDQNQVRVGVAITAEEPVDPDGNVSGVTWQWESSSDGSDPWTVISNATAAAYTPGESDVDNYLRATASYTDAQGPGKSASSDATPSAVLAATTGTEGTVTLSPTGTLDVGTVITATLNETDTLVGSVSWQWARSSSANGPWSPISGATSQSYTAASADVGNYLQATASYEDSSGPGQTAVGVTSAAVRLHEYDANSDGVIDRDEVLNAIDDYLDGGPGAPDREEILDLIDLYLG